ncbi:MAG: hypothetical protein JO253_00550, partial [Alphaproteobacteria bacterium]|nr:hypothetical protein [Alphaproteobacteria bacterium]
MKSVILFLLCAIACVATGDDITAATIHGGTVADGYQAGAYANIGTSDYNGYMAVLNNSRTAFFAEQFGTGAAALFAGHNPAYYAVGITSTAPNGAPALRVETQLRTDTAISVNGNIDASGQTVTAAKFNGDASTV